MTKKALFFERLAYMAAFYLELRQLYEQENFYL